MISHYGEGDTPAAALAAFVSPGGGFDEWARHVCQTPGAEADVDVYTAIDPADSDWPAEDIEEYGWEWVCGKRVSTHRVIYQPAGHMHDPVAQERRNREEVARAALGSDYPDRIN